MTFPYFKDAPPKTEEEYWEEEEQQPTFEAIDARKRKNKERKRKAKRALDGAEVELPNEYSHVGDNHPYSEAPPVTQEEMCSKCCDLQKHVNRIDGELNFLKHLMVQHPVRKYDVHVLLGRPAYDALTVESRCKAVPLGADRWLCRGHRCYARRFNFDDPCFMLPPQ